MSVPSMMPEAVPKANKGVASLSKDPNKAGPAQSTQTPTPATSLRIALDYKCCQKGIVAFHGLRIYLRSWAVWGNLLPSGLSSA